jgi:hypothetical protein
MIAEDRRAIEQLRAEVTRLKELLRLQAMKTTDIKEASPQTSQPPESRTSAADA